MARYLVTGGAGFIGSNLALTLAAQGETVRIVDDLSTGFWENLDSASAGRIETLTADIRDGEAMSRAMQGVEVVFHHAALGSVPLSIEDPVRADSVNVGGTVRVLEAARHAGVRRVIFAASSAAYGNEPTLPKTEASATDPLSPYAVSKLAGEGYAAVFSALYGLETLSFRYFNIFGPHQRPEGAYAAAIPRFVYAALTGQPLTLYGDGSATRDFCFVSNVVTANLAAANSPRRLSGEIVNIATGHSVTLLEVVEAISEALGSPPQVEHGPERAGDVKHSAACIDRARELLGYEPSFDLRKGLPSTIDFLRKLARARGHSC
ncbi:MAG: NAD-dependent epimerase/dehydratase family protein [Polyangiaceae bacterium]